MTPSTLTPDLTMTDSHSTPPRSPGWRDLRPRDDEMRHTTAPRRRLPSESAQPEAEILHRPMAPWFRRRSSWAVGTVVVVVLATVLLFALLPTRDGQPIARPAPISPTAAGSTTNPSEDPNGGDATTPAPAPPLPGTASPGPVIPPPAEPVPTGASTVGLIELNDAQFATPEGWTLFGDEVIEGDRRAVRVRHEATDAGLQAVTLVPEATNLSASCTSLVALQQTQFTEVSLQLVAPVGVDVALGTSVQCGFAGVRISDGVPNTVTFTLVNRMSDSHALMLRTTVPKSAAEDTTIRSQINAMTCGASTSFGVALPLC